MTQDYLDDYHASGFAVVKGLFGTDEVAELAEAFDRVYAEGMLHKRSFRIQNVLFNIADDANLGPIVRMVQWPSYFHKGLERFRRDPRILKLLEPLLGPNLKQIINQMHWKPPGAAMVEFGFHQDSKSRRPREAYTDLANSYIQTAIAIDPHRTGERRHGGLSRKPQDGRSALRSITRLDACFDGGRRFGETRS